MITGKTKSPWGDEVSIAADKEGTDADPFACCQCEADNPTQAPYADPFNQQGASLPPSPEVEASSILID